MSETHHQAQCLCKAVTIEYSHANKELGACHCSMCRKWSGGAYLGTDCQNVSFQGEEFIGRFNSSEWADRGFCKQCGTHLFYHLKPKDQYIVPIGLLSDSNEFVMDHQIFIEEKPSYYDFANDTKNMTGAEVFAMFGEE